MIAEQFEEILKKTSILPLPTATPTIGDSGKKTLWVVFVLMIIASAGFTALSWRVPLVSVSLRRLSDAH
jgi:hypothetical protein